MADTPQQTLVPNDPGLQDSLNLLKKDIFLNLNCHHLGTIESFDGTFQTATVSINYKKTFFEFNSLTGQSEPVLQDYPLLLDCPVVVLGGGNGSLTFPIAKGDECIVLINDRDIDNWFTGSSNSGTATARKHSMADGIALVGVRSQANVLVGYDDERSLLKGGTAKLGVGKSGNLMLIGNDSTTLNTVLHDLTNKLQDLTSKLNSLTGQIQSLVLATAAIIVTPGSLAGPSSPPLNLATITPIGTQVGTIGTQINTIGTQIGTIATNLAGLLE